MESNKQHTALLVMDIQAGILGSYPNASELTGKIADAIACARKQHIPVLYVRVGFRSGMPEVGVNNKIFQASKERMGDTDMDEWMKIDSSVEPLPNEIVITKRRISAFTGSDLEVVLRAQGIRHLILTGIATSGVVLSTLREAADKDYLITVLSDCCADRDDEVHHVLMSKVFTRQAEVLTAAEWNKLF
jgi:nicotinamidase-related amidase